MLRNVVRVLCALGTVLGISAVIIAIIDGQSNGWSSSHAITLAVATAVMGAAALLVVYFGRNDSEL